MRIHALTSSAVALVAIAFSPAPASADFDFAPSVGPGNKIVTNAFQDSDGTFISNVRVFTYGFEDDPDQPYFITDPGFHPQPNISGFNANTLVGFMLAAPLRFWSGSGSPSFPTITTSDRIRFEFGSNHVTTSSAPVPSPAGFLFASVNAMGEADDHLQTFLLAAGDDVSNPGTPSPGVYLVTIDVTTNQNGVAVSDPAYVMFGNDVDDDVLGEAAHYVHDAFAPDSTLVPEPTTAFAITSIFALAARCRRQA